MHGWMVDWLLALNVSNCDFRIHRKQKLDASNRCWYWLGFKGHCRYSGKTFNKCLINLLRLIIVLYNVCEGARSCFLYKSGLFITNPPRWPKWLITFFNQHECLTEAEANNWTCGQKEGVVLNWNHLKSPNENNWIHRARARFYPR